MKKGRHRRYEEARKFQRENAAASFSVEDFDFEDKDPWNTEDEGLDDSYEDLAAKYDDTAALAEKYADFDTNSSADED